MQNLTIFLKALADGNRLRLLAAVTTAGELCVCQLTALLEVSGATCSRHLALLVQAGLLDRRRDGRWMFYCSALKRLDRDRYRIAAAILALFAATDQAATDRARLDAILTANLAIHCSRKGLK